MSLTALAVALRDDHRFEEAAEYAERALPAARVSGVDAFVEPFVLYHIGRLAYLQNDLDRAVGSLTASLEQIHERGPTQTTLYANTLAAVHLKQGHLAKAAGLLREGSALLTPGGCRLWFDAIVLLAAKCRLPDHAARALGWYSAYYASLGISAAYVDPGLEADIGSLRDEVGGPHFDAEYQAGAALHNGRSDRDRTAGAGTGRSRISRLSRERNRCCPPAFPVRNGQPAPGLHWNLSGLTAPVQMYPPLVTLMSFSESARYGEHTSVTIWCWTATLASRPVALNGHSLGGLI